MGSGLTGASAASLQETPTVVPDDRPTDEPPPAGPTARPGDLRARFLHDSFAVPDRQLETTLPPDDPEADFAWGSITFVWPTRHGVQPVIMPLWRRLD
jgi:hypothetical protein